jgi:hypothetical protein
LKKRLDETTWKRRYYVRMNEEGKYLKILPLLAIFLMVKIAASLKSLALGEAPIIELH